MWRPWPFGNRSPRRIEPAQVDDGWRIYAIGDVHGRLDLLDDLLGRLAEDVAAAPPGLRCQVVYLGDYVDRGPDSRGVIDRLLHAPAPAGVQPFFLMGNHERSLLDFLDTPAAAAQWLEYGGLACLRSYGVGASLGLRGADRLAAVRDAFADALPQAHLHFLRSMQQTHRNGDYLFVHAGIRPGVTLDRQVEEDLLWIREPFLGSRADYGVRVIHGHSVTAQPQVRDNRIGIDTGAFAGGPLTACVLEGAAVRFLQSGSVAFPQHFVG